MSNLKRAAAIAAGIALVSSGVALADPLAAGKPAGVKRAQTESSLPAMAWIALGGVAVAGIAAAASSGGGQSTFTTVPASTTA